MSWLFSQALVEAYSAASCSDGEPCAQLNVMPTPHKFWRNDKTMDCSKLSQFGLTCNILEPTTQIAQTLLKDYAQSLITWSSAVDFRARTLVQQVKAQALPASEAACGENLHGLLAKYDQHTHSLKTAQCSLFEDLTPCLVTLPRTGTMRNGMLYPHETLAQTINETAFGLSPNGETFFHTPNTNGLDGGSNSRKALKKRMETFATPTTMDTLPPKSAEALMREATIARKGRSKPANLRDQVSNMQNWPTPTVNMVSGGANHNIPQVLAGKHGINLEGAVMNASMVFPTPQARDWKGSSGRSLKGMETDLPTVVKIYPTPTCQDAKNNGGPSQYRRTSNGKPRELQLNAEIGGALNPTWVEWLMGVPLGWSDLNALVTRKYRFALQRHFGCFRSV